MKSVLALAVCLAALSLPTAAQASSDACSGSVGVGTIMITSAAATYYVDERGAANGVWIYQESNQIHSLQRGGASAVVPGDSDHCSSTLVPDTLVE